MPESIFEEFNAIKQISVKKLQLHVCSSVFILALPFRRQLTDNQLHTIEKDAFSDLVALERL